MFSSTGCFSLRQHLPWGQQIEAVSPQCLLLSLLLNGGKRNGTSYTWVSLTLPGQTRALCSHLGQSLWTGGGWMCWLDDPRPHASLLRWSLLHEDSMSWVCWVGKFPKQNWGIVASRWESGIKPFRRRKQMSTKLPPKREQYLKLVKHFEPLKLKKRYEFTGCSKFPFLYWHRQTEAAHSGICLSENVMIQLI